MQAQIVGTTSSAPSTSAVNYNVMNGGGTSSWSTTEAARSQVVPHAMVIDRLRMTVTTAPAAGKSYAFALMVNGSASALTCTISDAATTAQDLSNTVSLSAGDVISIRCTPTGTPTASGTVYWNLRQDATNLFGVLGINVGAPSSGTNYMAPQGRPLISATDAIGSIIVPTGGVLKNLYLKSRVAPGAGTSWAVTLMLNGASQSLTATIADVATTANDTTNTVTVAAGDLISLQIVATGSPTSTSLSYGMSFDPTTDGQSFLAYMGNSLSPSTTATQFQQNNAHDGTWNATEANRVLKFGATTIQGMYVQTSVSPGAAPNQYIFTERNEIADTTAIVTITDASTAVGSTRVGNITGLSATVADDDRMSIQSVPSSSPTAVNLKSSLLLYTAPPSGILADAVSGSGYQAASSSYSWSHTCTGTDRYLTIGVSMLSLAQTVTSITYNSVALTFLGAQNSVTGAARVELWGLIAPSTGSNTIAVTLSGAIASGSNASSYTGVHQTSPTEGFNGAQATNVGAADATVNITTVADNDWVVDTVASDDASITVGAGQTQTGNITGAGGSAAMSYEGPKTPAGSVTMSWTGVAALATWSIGGIALRPVAAANLGNHDLLLLQGVG